MPTYTFLVYGYGVGVYDRVSTRAELVRYRVGQKFAVDVITPVIMIQMVMMIQI